MGVNAMTGGLIGLTAAGLLAAGVARAGDEGFRGLPPAPKLLLDKLPPAPKDIGLPKRTLMVGPGRFYRSPSEAARDASHGDTVLIEPGEYVDCAVWRGDRLTIKPATEGGRVHVKTKTCEGKAIWVVKGDDAVISNITFSGARVPSRNGAGIRLEGTNLTIIGGRFYGNEMGILTGVNLASALIIEGSVFERNGIPVNTGRIGHGVYAGKIGRLVVRGSTFREHYIGHHIKSRAALTEIIGNTIADGARGTASYLIDLPNGGASVIRDNRLSKGAGSDNRTTAISIGAEGATNRTGRQAVSGNRFENHMPHPVIFVRNGAPGPAILSGNRFEGPVRALAGPGEVR